MSSLSIITRRRFHLLTVAIVIFGGAFGLVLFNYIIKFINGVPFQWDAFWEYFPNLLLGTVITTLYSYLILNYFFDLFNRRKPFHSFIAPVLLSMVLIQVYNIAVDYYLPLKANVGNPLPLSRQIVGNLLVAALLLTLILVLAYITNLRDVRKQHRLLQQQKLQLEVEKSQAELKFLKSQINPHFLHNTLNSFYARSLPLSKELADNILTLSEMMRYALSQSMTDDGKVLLKDELEHVKNLIKINQFRFRDKLNIQLKVKGEVGETAIIPFVLVTLVENIFKHGDLSNSDYMIKICLEIIDGKLCYYSQNKKKAGPKELSTGIGLDNIRKRLDLSYHNNYQLIITNENDLYTTELIIDKL